MFPGDSEGMQLLEQAAALGFPNDEEMNKLDPILPVDSFELLSSMRQAYSNVLKGTKLEEIFEIYIENEEERLLCTDLLM